MADFLLVLLRAIHILGAVVWAGGTFVLAGFHEYVLHPGNPEQTLQRMADYDDMSTMVGASGIITVLAGLILYWLVSDGLNWIWITSSYGLTITLGALAGLAAIVVGIPMVGFTNNRATELHAKIQSRDEITEQHAEAIETLQKRLKLGERAVAVLLAIAVLAMATAQYM